MSVGALSLELSLLASVLWLGLYLLSRDLAEPRLRYAGLGLVAFAGALACDVLAAYAPQPVLAVGLARLRWLLASLPALLWSGAIIHLLPPEAPTRSSLDRLWQRALAPLGSALVILVLLGAPPSVAPSTAIHALWLVLLLLPLALTASRVLPALWHTGRGRLRGPLIIGVLFFGLSTGLAILTMGWLPPLITLPLIGFDLLWLGVVIAAWDAFDQGEAFLPDFLRAADFALFAVLLFGGQVALAMVVATGITFPMLLLLLTTMTTALVTQAFATRLGGFLDAIAFARFPHLRHTRSQLRVAAAVAPRVNPTLDLLALDDAEFTRLTRRALSHLTDFERLAASPLTFLPQVEARLAERGEPGAVLERAGALKEILAESIERLKPRGKGDFGATDEWRHYNALYFPYIIGLRPYSRRAVDDTLDDTARAALDWLRAQVPERTLYNWQAAAARLVAQDLRAVREPFPEVIH
jgi:hypothetical protein